MLIFGSWFWIQFVDILIPWNVKCLVLLLHLILMPCSEKKWNSAFVVVTRNNQGMLYESVRWVGFLSQSHLTVTVSRIQLIAIVLLLSLY